MNNTWSGLVAFYQPDIEYNKSNGYWYIELSPPEIFFENAFDKDFAIPQKILTKVFADPTVKRQAEDDINKFIMSEMIEAKMGEMF